MQFKAAAAVTRPLPPVCAASRTVGRATATKRSFLEEPAEKFFSRRLFLYLAHEHRLTLTESKTKQRGGEHIEQRAAATLL